MEAQLPDGDNTGGGGGVRSTRRAELPRCRPRKGRGIPSLPPLVSWVGAAHLGMSLLPFPFDRLGGLGEGHARRPLH